MGFVLQHQREHQGYMKPHAATAFIYMMYSMYSQLFVMFERNKRIKFYEGGTKFEFVKG